MEESLAWRSAVKPVAFGSDGDASNIYFSWVKAIVMQFFKTTAAASASATHIAVVILFCASWVLWKIYSIFQSLLPMECRIIFYVIIRGK